MTRHRLPWIVAIGGASVVLGMLLVMSLTTEPMLSDEAYRKIAQETTEARLFLKKYPQATVTVDRSGALAVDFRVNAFAPTASSRVPPYLRLRVFIGPQNRPTLRFLDCQGRLIVKDLLDYLRTETCLSP